MEQNLKQLIDRYMDGLTTNEEERILRNYFRQTTDVPDEWKPLRAIFRFVETEQEALPQPQQTSARVVSIHRRVWQRWVAVASVAAAVLVLGALPFITQRGRNFAIINGQRTTSQTVIMQEAENALQLVAIDDADAFGALDELNVD